MTSREVRVPAESLSRVLSGGLDNSPHARGAHPGQNPDLAAVTYCDLAGLRAILSLAGAASGGHPGAGLLVLGILGWDATPGLVIDDEFTAPPDCGYRTG